ncbi:MAG: cytochrome c oxidase subunit 3 [Bacteroidetes bacterium]|nr:cytochrome c oxidase subunit 3 [Bacteroidota bacterium]
MKNITINSNDTTKVNPKKFVLWLIIIAIIMFFAGLTSAYLVRKGEGNWLNFKLPLEFILSTGVIILSSISLLFAKKASVNDKLSSIKIGLFITLILGLLFCYLQYLGWVNMNSQNLYFSYEENSDKISATFIYALSGLHVLHVLAGIIFIIAIFIKSIFNKINSHNLLPIELCSIYWHFIGIVWIYLFIFFNIS